MQYRVLPQLKQQGRGGSISGAFAAGAASLVVRQANAYRKQCSFTNDSVNVIYLAKGDIAILNAGIRLGPAGTCILEPDVFGDIWTGPVSAIATAAASNLCWTEDW